MAQMNHPILNQPPDNNKKLWLNVYGCYGLHSLLLPNLMEKYKSSSGDHTDDIRLSKLQNQTPWYSYTTYETSTLEEM